MTPRGKRPTPTTLPLLLPHLNCTNTATSVWLNTDMHISCTRDNPHHQPIQLTHNACSPLPPPPLRYLAELVKFRLAAPSSLLLRLKALLDDFSGPHVEAATTLVENAGRFLLRTPGTVAQPHTVSHTCIGHTHLAAVGHTPPATPGLGPILSWELSAPSLAALIPQLAQHLSPLRVSTKCPKHTTHTDT
jgi:hypothetical protein